MIIIGEIRKSKDPIIKNQIAIISRGKNKNKILPTRNNKDPKK